MSHEPLTPQERELADALARLPAIEPPEALDARIRSQAREALRPAISRHRRHKPWWMGASMGTAAAAVLAAGVAWQAGFFDISLGSDAPVPRTSNRVATSEADSAIAIDLSHAPTATAPLASPPAPRSETSAASAQQAAKPAPSTSPSPPPSTQGVAEPEPKAAAPAAAPLHRQAPAPASADAMSETLSVTGSRMLPDTSHVLPHWREDELLAPDQWLERIRERVRRGERNSAALSLRRFALKHPSHAVPDDLIPLLAGRF